MIYVGRWDLLPKDINWLYEASEKEVAEEISRDLEGQGRIFQGDGLERFEPHIELLRLNDLLNDPETVVPNVDMLVVVHSVFRVV